MLIQLEQFTCQTDNFGIEVNTVRIQGNFIIKTVDFTVSDKAAVIDGAEKLWREQLTFNFTKLD
ncbi:hypothetical protein D3C80_2241380 [compost metagenome]